jgi:gliding motility-associated-like protein
MPIIVTPNLPAFNNFVSTNSACFNSGVGSSISTNAIGTGSNFTFTLLPGNSSNQTGFFNNLLPGTYTVICTDAFNCAITTSATLLSPSPIAFTSAQATHVLCFGQATGSISVNALGGAGIVNYININNGATDASGNFAALGAAAYTIQAIDANNCIIATTITITQNTQINFDSIRITSPICKNINNGSINLQVSGGIPSYAFALNTLVFTSIPQFNNIGASTYTIWVKDALNCTRSTTINVNPSNLFSIGLLDLKPPTCTGDSNAVMSVIASGTNTSSTYNYQILPQNYFNSSGIFTNLNVGSYTIVAIDNKGCTEQRVINVTDNSVPIKINMLITPIICATNNSPGGIIASVTGGIPPYQYNWIGLSNYNSSINNLQAGVYTLTVTDDNNCINTQTATVPVAECCTVQFPNAFTPADGGANNWFGPITVATVADVQYMVYDRWGNRVFETKSTNDRWNGTYGGVEGEPGYYFYVYKYRCLWDNKVYQLKGDLLLLR